LIGQAKTGTGKTLGFGIPLLSRIVSPTSTEWGTLPGAGKPQALVVVPTRELAVQVAADLERASANLGIRVACVYGGRAYEPQIAMLESGIEAVVGTPGRLLDLARQRFLDLGHVRVLVLDEADEMLDMGFLPDVEKLVSLLPAKRQTMLFSATMPGQIVALARRYMSAPTHIRAVDPDSDSSLVDSIEQHVWRAHQMDKPELIARVLQAEGRGLTMIFCRTKRTAGNLTDDLTNRGFACAAVHGDLGQGAREQALRAFRNGKVDVLIATDVAARGIDVADVTHVINYECPDDDKTYVHRIGRTGRAGNSGVAITLVDWQDMARWQMINRTLGLPFHEPLETYSSSEHVYTGLGIPTGVSGMLPSVSRSREGLAAEHLEDLGGPTPRRKSGNTSAQSGSSGGKSKSSRKPIGNNRGGSQQGSRDRSGARGNETSVAPRKSEDDATRGSRSRRRTRKTKPAD
jgi:superfamily II DNA/RNA helicase